jgi:nuclear pore complex protein Nup205
MGKSWDVANDRLFQLFRVCLRGIHSPVATTQLRETFYNICYRYLTGMAEISSTNPVLRRHSTQTVKAAGERLIDVICDDAYTGEETCRISALLLDALVSLAKQEESRYIIDSLVRINFIGILVDAIKNIPIELRATIAQGRFFIKVYIG